MPTNHVSSSVAAAILAGGRNKRMDGNNKALIHINGACLLEQTISLLKKTFQEVFLVTNAPQDFRSYAGDVVITTDLIKDKGPLGGIHAVLSRTAQGAVFFVACDMPFLHNALIRRQLDCFSRVSCDCLVPRIGSCIEPLHAIYKKSLVDRIESFIKDDSDYSIRGFLEVVNVYYWDLKDNHPNRKVFENLNTPGDLRRVRGTLCA